MIFADSVLDAALQVFRDRATAIHLTDAAATTFAEATTNAGGGGFKLGTKSAPTISAQENPPSGTGRQVRIVAFSDGNVEVAGTATHWALVASATTELLATGALDASQVVSAGNTWFFKDGSGNPADLPLIIREPI